MRFLDLRRSKGSELSDCVRIFFFSYFCLKDLDKAFFLIFHLENKYKKMMKKFWKEKYSQKNFWAERNKTKTSWMKVESWWIKKFPSFISKNIDRKKKHWKLNFPKISCHLEDYTQFNHLIQNKSEKLSRKIQQISNKSLNFFSLKYCKESNNLISQMCTSIYKLIKSPE